jgi:hypothetical protein
VSDLDQQQEHFLRLVGWFGNVDVQLAFTAPDARFCGFGFAK